MVRCVCLLFAIVFLLIIPDETLGWSRRPIRRPACYRRNCAVSFWSRWSACSYDCGVGKQTRTRTKTRTESCGGSCPYGLRQTKNCNNGCPNGGTPVFYTYGRCKCKTGFTGRCCTEKVCYRVNCAVGSWSSWSTCSYPCGQGGKQTRTRTKTRKESCGGSCPYGLRQTKQCNNGCPNGGTPDGGRCTNCRSGFTGRCCDVAVQQGCQEGSSTINNCGERCLCRQGKLECTRIRKEFTTMTTAERKKYIETIKTASTDQRYKTDYDNLITSHRTLFQAGIHVQDNFLPWHRWFNLQYENILRRVDCTVTVSYWDWSRVSGTAWRGGEADVWYSGDSGFGGKGNCVQTGPFRQNAWSLVPSADSTCLSRGFTGLPPDTIAVQEVLNIDPTQFESFEETLRDNIHDSVHCDIGGTMCTLDAAAAPEFFLHHSFIDKLWDDWQAKSSRHRNAHFSELTANMPGVLLSPAALIDLTAHPDGTRVEYRPVPQPRMSVSQSGRFKTSQFGRPKFSTVNERAMKLFNVKPEERKKVEEMAEKLDTEKSGLKARRDASDTQVSDGFLDSHGNVQEK